MYLCPEEVKSLKSKEIRELQLEYKEKVSHVYPGYNPDDFKSIEDYVTTLKRAIETGVPWKWRGGDA